MVIILPPKESYVDLHNDNNWTKQPDEDNSAILIMMAITITEVGAGLRIDHKALRKMFPVGCLP
jgi:hypothetical protein